MPSLDAPIRFDDTGRGAPALVFVHGFSCDRADWTAQVARFSPTHRCIAVDLPAHGASPRAADASIEGCAAALDATLAALGLDEVVLVGHSMGCRVALATHARAPGRTRGLVLVDGSFVGGDVDAVVAGIAARIDAAGIEAFLEALYEDFFVEGTPPGVRAAVEARRGRLPRDVARALAIDLGRWDCTRARAAMASVDVPTLAIQSTVLDADMRRVPVPAGTLSPFCRALRDAVPGATIATIACGHFTMLEQPDATDAAIASFLGRLAARGPGG